jgi:hypothetical protein
MESRRDRLFEGDMKAKIYAPFVFAVLVVSGLIALPRSVFHRAASQPPRRFIIDSHQHYSEAPDYIARLVKVYAARNAMACVLTPMSGFEVVKKAAADYPDVIIPYGVISVDNPKAIAEVRKFAAAGFKGIKMHTPKHNWDDFGYFPIYEKLQLFREGKEARSHESLLREVAILEALERSVGSDRWEEVTV